MSLLFVGHPNERDLALFAGGELGPLARWRIEKHLQNCSQCEEMVADFFHLQGELEELAELPALDWNAQARAILERAERQPAASTQRGFGGLFPQPLALRAGLAMAAVLCAVVVIRQFPEQEKTARPEVAVVADSLSASKQSAGPASQAPQAKVDGAEAIGALEIPSPAESALLSDSIAADSIAADSNAADSISGARSRPVWQRS
jgi:anti-sigma factor RsiW